MFKVLRRFRRSVARCLLPILALTWLSALVEPCVLAWQPETQAAERHASVMDCCCEETSIHNHPACADWSCPDIRAADALGPEGLPAPVREPWEVPPVLESPPLPLLAPAVRSYRPSRPAYARTPSSHPALRFQRLLT